MAEKVRIIDLFAGPGGLGEGFSNCTDSPYQIEMSVEADADAHKTLTLRAFYRRLSGVGKRKLRKYFRTGDEAVLEYLIRYPAYSEKWAAALEETMGEPTRIGNDVYWGKIKAGIEPTEEDRQDTAAQQAISERIRQIKREAKNSGDLLMVIGGPPCQAYSVNGRNRVRVEKNYKPDEDERFFLYLEYCRVLDEAEPDLFIMENVQGMLSARLATGELILPNVLEALQQPYKARGKKKGARYHLYSLAREPDYFTRDGAPVYLDPASFNIKSQNYGIPQTRHRVIIFGLKAGNGEVHRVLKPLHDEEVSISDIIDTMPPIRSGISSRGAGMSIDSYRNWEDEWNDAARELKDRIAFADFGAQIERFKKRRMELGELDIEHHTGARRKKSGFSEEFDKIASSRRNLKRLRKWIATDHDKDEEIGFYNHSAKFHKALDRKIYLFASAYSAANSDAKSPSPKSKDFPAFLAPDHKNWKSGKYADRFRCLEASKVANTITSHLRKDGHAYIHYDGAQNRCLSPREAARVQTFPDDYFFTGSQGSQYQQVGNAVPPYLAKQIAELLVDILKEKELLSDI